jgi:hypothetical protein
LGALQVPADPTDTVKYMSKYCAEQAERGKAGEKYKKIAKYFEQAKNIANISKYFEQAKSIKKKLLNIPRRNTALRKYENFL